MLKQVRVAVVGSINMDLVTNAPRFPRMGETPPGTDFNRLMGGKGINQAVVATRLDVDVYMIGVVSDDGFGYEMLTDLDRGGVCNDYVRTVQGYSSGIASIIVADDGNLIVIVSGTNSAPTPEDVLAYGETIAGSNAVLSQLEMPMECVITVTKLAQKHGRPFVLNPTLAQRLPQELLELTTLLTPNTYELAVSLGLPQDMSAEELIGRSPCPMLTTVGKKGAVYNDEQGVLHYVSNFPITPVDPTSAGDTFDDAFVVYWKEGMEAAVRKICAAVAVSITQNGAQSGMPSKEELEEFLTIRQ